MSFSWFLAAAALVAAVAALAAGYALVRARRVAARLGAGLQIERDRSTSLEKAVTARTTALEEAQRVLQRMWWLGQQITLELNPQRVLERFLEAVVDITQADGGAMGMVGEDGKIRIVAATGVGTPLLGSMVPVMGSAMGRVLRGGGAWTVTDASANREQLYLPVHELCTAAVGGMAIIPIVRRGQRIGAVTLVACRVREFTPSELEHVAAMADLLSLSLENAELVETLRQAEWRFRTLFRAAPDAVFTALQSGRIREANDAVREVTGYDPHLVVGRPVTDLVMEGDRARLDEALVTAFSGAPARLEVSIRPPGDKTETPRRIVELAISRLPEADPPSVLLVGRDMTGEREMRRRLMESDRLAAVGELVAGVAHEVNNPLSSISAFAQLLLRDEVLSESQRESVEVIRSETMRASQVVKDLLAFARRSEPQRAPVDLNGIVTRTLRMRGFQLTQSNVNVELALAPELPSVIGDARQLQQVCLNLVTNAIQAMATLGGGSLTVTTRADPALRQGVVLEMRDTGPGIPSDARARIFEPFFTTKQEGEGTGLGLSVSYGIIAAHGGSIEVSDTSSAGTTFRVTLPTAEPVIAPVEHVPGVSAPLVLSSPLSGLRLLFVDDEAPLRQSVVAFAELRGFTAITAADGRAALELLRSTEIDAVVCDLRMPGMDGATFLQHLRRERPALAARTVFVTGDVIGASSTLVAIGTSNRTPSVPWGFGISRQPVLAKPFSFEQLEEALIAIMRGSPQPAGRR